MSFLLIIFLIRNQFNSQLQKTEREPISVKVWSLIRVAASEVIKRKTRQTFLRNIHRKMAFGILRSVIRNPLALNERIALLVPICQGKGLWKGNVSCG